CCAGRRSRQAAPAPPASLPPATPASSQASWQSSSRHLHALRPRLVDQARGILLQLARQVAKFLRRALGRLKRAPELRQVLLRENGDVGAVVVDQPVDAHSGLFKVTGGDLQAFGKLVHMLADLAGGAPK